MCKTGQTALLLIMIILASLAATTFHANAQPPLQVDLFTQKASPYDGKGPNNASDAFTLLENVTLFTLVTYNGAPVPSVFVTYVVKGPENPTQNYTIIASKQTQSNGIATYSFRIPNNEMTTFGTWNVTARVDLAGNIATDTLTFKVGWIVNITSLATVDESLQPKTEFTPGSTMVANITLENIALQSKDAFVAITLTDSMGILIDKADLSNIPLAGNSSASLYASLHISTDATKGSATVYVTVFTALPELGGIPYAPERSTKITIVTSPIPNHDLAIVNVTASATEVYIGDFVNIMVLVRNKGTITENTLNISAYFDDVLVSTLSYPSLSPNAEATLTFAWNTSNIAEGDYRIKAEIVPVEGETNLADNTFVDGVIRIRSESTPPPPPEPLFPRWLAELLAIILALLLIFIISLLLYRRRKRKEQDQSFSRAWKAWYAGLNIENK